MKKSDTIKFDSAIKHIITFHNHVLRHNRIIDKLTTSSSYPENDLNHIQEAILIKQMTAWEQFLTHIIPYCICRNTSKLSENIGIDLPKEMSEDNVLAILNGINFTNIRNTIDLESLTSDLIHPNFNPFQQFLPPMLKYIDEAYILRNYSAHKSHISKAKVAKMYSLNYSINTFLIPGEFLRTKRKYEWFDVEPYQQYYFVMHQIAILCWRFLDKPTYDKIYKADNPKEVIGLGYLNIDGIFERLTDEYNLDE